MAEPVLIGAEPLGLCRFCRKPLFATTARCPARSSFGGRLTPRQHGAPPCPVDDGTLRALQAAVGQNGRT